MKVFTSSEDIQKYLSKSRMINNSIGLVPTMGALHEGHLELIQKAKSENNICVVSIFVNPTQFNSKEDYEKYPISLESDLELIEKYADVVFNPSVDEMYQGKSLIKLDFQEITKHMEGEFRPGHFSGVGLIVSKLFNIIKPDVAYFGQKDYQQFAVINQLNKEFKFGIDLVRVDTVREPDGLAMSSRNRRLSTEERKKALLFYNSLNKAKEMLIVGDPIEKVKNIIVNDFKEEEENIQLEYIEIADAETLEPIVNLNGYREAVICIAGYVGNVRLIDNTFLNL